MTNSPTPISGEPRSTTHTPSPLSAVHPVVVAVAAEVADVHTKVADADRLGALRVEVAELHTEVGELHTEVSELHAEVADLHTEVADYPAELEALQDQVDHLEVALDSSQGISPAVGIVMERLGLSQDDAFQVLARSSQVRNVELRQVADEIVATGSLPDGVVATEANPGGE